jgi:hypothetical protein
MAHSSRVTQTDDALSEDAEAPADAGARCEDGSHDAHWQSVVNSLLANERTSYAAPDE